MAFLRNVASGAVSFNLDPDDEAFQLIVKQRDANNRPVWEEVGETAVAGASARVAIASLPALGAAVDDTSEFGIDGLSEGGAITSAEFIPDVQVTGVDTNTRTITVEGAGGGTVHCTLALAAAAGVLAPGVAKAMVVNSAAVAAGEKLIAKSAHAGTGLAAPTGIITVEITPTA